MISIFLPLRWELLLSQRAMLSIVAAVATLWWAAALFGLQQHFEPASALSPDARAPLFRQRQPPLARSPVL